VSSTPCGRTTTSASTGSPCGSSTASTPGWRPASSARDRPWRAGRRSRSSPPWKRRRRGRGRSAPAEAVGCPGRLKRGRGFVPARFCCTVVAPQHGESPMIAVLPVTDAQDPTPKLGELPDPLPGRGEVLIDVAATAINHAELLQLRGFYPPPPAHSVA